MYELIKITENDYYIDCPAKIGVVKISENEVVLIDSGNDKDAAKKVLKVLNANNWNLVAVYNTHSHADHIGGNNLLQERTNCLIYANGIEAAYSNYPQLEGTSLYGGRPFKDLKNKFILAKESRVLSFSESGDELLGGIKILNLPGHCSEMVGFLTKDGTAYIADSVSSEETLEKYGIGYLWDYSETIRTLEFLKTLDANSFVPAHAQVTNDIKGLADYNIEKIEQVKQNIIEFCRDGICFEDLLQKVFSKYGLTMTSQQYALIGSTIRSYLSALYDEGILTFSFEDNKMKWITL